MLHRIGLPLLAAAALGVAPAAEEGAGGGIGGTSAGAVATLADADRRFAEQALSAGMYEVMAAQILLQREPKDPKELEFAQMMIRDHGETNRLLQRLLQDKGVVARPKLDDAHQALIDDLKGLQGDELQKRYHEQQVQVHDQALELFTRAARVVQDDDLRAWAKQTLPTLQAHRNHLETHDREMDQ